MLTMVLTDEAQTNDTTRVLIQKQENDTFCLNIESIDNDGNPVETQSACLTRSQLKFLYNSISTALKVDDIDFDSLTDLEGVEVEEAIETE